MYPIQTSDLFMKGNNKDVFCGNHGWSAPLHPRSWATTPWERIHVDYVEVNKQQFLVVIDGHSKWIEVLPTKLTTAEKTFLEHCLPHMTCQKMLVSDNGPQFTVPEFEQFLIGSGVCHIFSRPYHLASKDAVESVVQTFKNAWI